MTRPAADAPLLIAVDQGTSATKAVAVARDGSIVADASVPLAQQHPASGWVEQDPLEIAQSVVDAVERVLAQIDPARVAGLGLSSQRESALAWDLETGDPLGAMLGWQDRRTAATARGLLDAGHGERVRQITGLPIDPMFSALKLAWLLDRHDPDRTRSRAGRLAVGTVDAWLLWRLTGEHRIEAGNASRTQLLDLATADWSDELLELFGIPREVLPAVVASDAPSAPVRGIAGLPDGTRIHAVLGDSHAALYGHGVRAPGAVKTTYGTGSSVMGLLPEGADAGRGLARTLAWQIDGEARTAFEGNILATGATLVWLARLLGSTPAQVMELAAAAEPGELDLVPAFAGLGAPWWDEDARAVLVGFDLGAGAGQIARAAAESIVLQVEDVLEAADAAVGTRIELVLADGGPSANPWLMQLQADLGGRVVRPSAAAELSALGAAHLAGRAVGIWSDAELAALPRSRAEVAPQLDRASVAARRSRWLDAVARARTAPVIVPDLLPVPDPADQPAR
ncbi:FGGY family carbohydrate kinase [Homoserinibacter sp. YIM 151385]|uniref:FGGY family carbohydrate kinase n=1 Tax=Homoserinibacter sp. YIM 151385 TaxID=2985506 RepID=UPI0022EFF3BB|nr:FGGY family carbohydrate kinase [Homoserinibacter sp. YIM 151385]WBU37919.1 FGGY family carbohydrate kinase [Homoserinibacter sp. YIM 151385]